jgi:hypothetical protein
MPRQIGMVKDIGTTLLKTPIFIILNTWAVTKHFLRLQILNALLPRQN